MVTPIYPSDAAAIVALLDIHAAPPERDDFEPLEILEAGTGHGSLSLQLLKAMHGANTKEGVTGAILHTIEKEAGVSELARTNLRNFRRGMYAGDGVRFYTGNVEHWLKEEVSRRRGLAK